MNYLPAALFSLPCFFTGTGTAFRLASYGMMLYENKNISDIDIVIGH
jgi:hypothetical protein